MVLLHILPLALINNLLLEIPLIVFFFFFFKRLFSIITAFKVLSITVFDVD